MTQLDDRTMANLDVVLEAVCRSLPRGGDHELRKAIAEKLLDSALKGTGPLAGSPRSREPLAETTKKSA